MKRRSKINQDVQFVNNDIVKVPRTTQFLKTDWQGTFNAGDLVPFKVIDVLPGSTHSITIDSLTRTNSPFIKPLAGTIELHVAGYYIPFRITWTNFDKFVFGYQDDPDWTVDPEWVMPFTEYRGEQTGSSPNFEYNGYSCFQGSVGDMLDLATNLVPYTPKGANLVNVCSLYARGYAITWNEWYRDEANQRAISVDKGDVGANLCQFIGIKSNDDFLVDWYSDDLQLGFDDWNSIYGQHGPLNYGKMCPLNKKRDLFTAALPNPQKGAPVVLSIGGQAPLGFNDGNIVSINWNAETEWPFTINEVKGTAVGGITVGDVKFGNAQTNNNAELQDYASKNVGLHSKSGHLYGTFGSLAGVYADLANISAINVNDLRFAVQTQIIKETDARYGTRPKEGYYGHFGVISSDARMQIPEYLGSYSVILNINQVVQNSASVEGSAQANLAAFSQTSKHNYLFTKSFTEYGFVLLVCGIRSVGGAYSQGVPKIFDKKSRWDLYVPELDHIGEQPIKNKELFVAQYDFESIIHKGLDNDGVFGYQGAWYMHRYWPNSVHGLVRPSAVGSLAYWNLSYNFNTTPTLSEEFIKEDRSLIDRALAYPSQNAETGEYTGVDQFFCEFWIQDKATQPMSLQSIPGFMDHPGKIYL